MVSSHRLLTTITAISDTLCRGAHSDLVRDVGVALSPPAALAAAGSEPWSREHGARRWPHPTFRPTAPRRSLGPGPYRRCLVGGSPAALAAAGLEPWAGRAELACRAPFSEPLRRGAHSDLVRDVVVAVCAPAALAAVGSVGGGCSVCLALLRRAALAGTADDSVAPGTCCSVSSLFTFWRLSRPRPPAAPPLSCVQAPSWRLPSTTRSG